VVRVTEAQAKMLLEGNRTTKKGNPRIKRSANQTPENLLEDSVCAFLRLRRWFVQRNHVGLFRTLDGKRVITVGNKGTPDWSAEREVEVLRFGNHQRPVCQRFYFELKSPTKKPSDVQQEWMIGSRMRGIQAWWFDRFDGPGENAFLPWYRANFE
jgi:hypothetical protein